ncbi:4-nitrophenyl phosphatase [Pelagirhabdus alkalitolerans]|uniref:4-nitrophenyl phosphatase n=1 Tax=Pelagirhabdus alkalitolerans TaxID=1612202 RepID=A0A1G6IJ01_9BACI|nr:TIGR01457 family HAD-type hydrolase [Pelagirhabdus alkalitolerans]SDC06468.1 4-nitrophenyl phosphatase [Pelagirhabdus alkalitolerans]
MKKYSGYLIDLDGTVYNGTEKIPEAVQFVKQLNEESIPYLFLTNNSTKHPKDVANKLRDMGIDAKEKDVFTTSMATATYISEMSPGARVYPIGEEGLDFALKQAGLIVTDQNIDYVVMGLDRGITYEKLATGALAIRNGAKFIATNGDVALPSERGFLPGAGSLISVLSVTTGVKPIFVGKPESIIVDQAMDVLGTEKSETVMVGDNYYTDILAGIRAGIDSLLVFSGVTTPDDLSSIDEQPTYTIDTLDQWSIK